MLWRELAEMTQAADLPPSAIFEAFGTWYTVTQAVAVRRQLDRDQRSVSLANLLADMAEHADVMTRARHLALWGDGEDWQEPANRNFDRFSTEAALDPAVPSADLAELESVAEIMRRYVNKAVAHLDQDGLDELPTYSDLNAAIDLIGELLRKYTSLLEATIIGELEPVIQYDWKAPFRHPWLPDEA